MTEEKKNSTSVGKNRYMATVKVGSKGQIVIPQKARQLLHLKPGDMLLMRADSSSVLPFNHLIWLAICLTIFSAHHLTNF